MVSLKQIHHVGIIHIIAVQVDPQCDPVSHIMLLRQKIKVLAQAGKSLFPDNLRRIAVYKDPDLRMGNLRNKTVHQQSVGIQGNA